MNPEVQPPKTKRRLRKKYIVLLVALLVVGGLGGGVYATRSSLTSPVKGEIVQSLPADTKQSQVELAQYDGTTFSFVHPMTFIEQTGKTTPQANQLESHTFISSGMTSELLTTVVSKLPSGDPNDDASYYMRAQNSAKYKMKTATVKNEKVVVFSATDSQQYQQAAFWAHGGKLLTLVLTGSSSDVPAMTTEFNDLTNSVSWR